MLDEQHPIEKGQSHNVFRRDVDDMALVDLYKLDPKVAYTPAINTAIVNAQYADTYKTLLSQGNSEKEAKSTASRHRAEANKRVSASVKALNKQQ